MMYYTIGTDNLSYKYFLIAPKDIDKYCSKNKFIIKAKVKEGSYAEVLMSRIYDGLVLGRTDLKEEYRKYYYEEYDTFQLFLYNKYLIEFEEMEYLDNYMDENYTIYFGDLKYNDGYDLGTFIKDNPKIIEKINCIFKECINEN